MVPGTGIEPVQPYGREILSLLCLPISPSGLNPTIIPAPGMHLVVEENPEDFFQLQTVLSEIKDFEVRDRRAHV